MTIITDKELGRGLDGFHAETKLTEGFVVEAANFLPSYSGSLIRRVGYQRVGGYLPLRIRSITRSGTTLTLQLSNTISTAGWTPSPISIWARIVPRGGSGFADLGGITPAPAVLSFPTFTIVSATSISVTGVTNTGYTQTIIPSADISTDYTTVGLDAYLWGIPSSWLVAGAVDSTRTTWITGLFSHTSATTNTPLATGFRAIHALGQPAGAAVPTTQSASVAGTPASTQTIGRAIYGAAPSSPATRGWLASPGIGATGYLAVTSATYDAATGHTIYVLAAPGLITSGSISGVIRSGIDLLTVTQMAYSQLDGALDIVSVTSGSGSVTIVCSNPTNAAVDSRHSDAGGAGRAGVFTDVISVVSGARILPGDLITPGNLAGEPPDWTCVAASSTTVVVSGVEELTTHLLPISTSILTSRSSGVLPVQSVVGLVRGDLISATGYARQFVVRSVRPAGDVSVTIVGNGFFATASGLASTADWRVGDGFQLWNAGQFTGVQIVVSIPSGTQLEFSSAATGTHAGTIMGSAVYIDDAPTVTSSTTYTVPARWYVAPSIDAPNTRASQTLVHQFPLLEGGASDAAFVSAAQVGGSTFLTNEFDAVQKYDGASTYRAGLPWWSPLIGFDVHNQSAALIQNPGVQFPGAVDASGAKFTATTASSAAGATPGMNVVVAVTGTGTSANVVQQWPATVVSSDSTSGIVTISPPVPSSYGITSATLYQAIQLRYYSRYVARDGNGVAVATGAFSSLDTTVVIGPPSIVTMKLALLSLSGIRPYNSVELEIYRTGTNSASPPVADGAPPFYRITVIPLKYAFDAAAGVSLPVPPTEVTRYFETYEDSNQISLGSSGAVDVISTALTGGTSVGADWDEPPRALTTASMNGRLLLGNIRSRPEMYLAIRESPTRSPSAFTPTIANGVQCIFRRGQNLGAGTDIANTQVYEFADLLLAPLSFNPKIRSLSPGFITFSADLTLSSPVQAVVGGWLYAGQILTASVQSQAYGGLELSGWFQVSSVSASVTYPGFTDITCLWPERNRLHVTTPATQISPGARTITVDNSVSSSTNLTTGSPIFFSGISSATGLTEGVQYWAIIPAGSTSQLKVAATLANALLGTAIALTATGPAFSISMGYLPGVGGSGSFITSAASSPYNIPVPLLLGSRLPGNYSPEWAIQTTSSQLQLAVDFLGRAIRSVNAGNWINPTAGSTKSRDNWLQSDSGGNYPFATVRVRTPSDSTQWTVQWANTTDDTGREKLLVYSGDARIPNFAFLPTDVLSPGFSGGSPWVSRVGHGLTNGQAVYLTSGSGLTAALPSPLVAGTAYYAVVPGPNHFGFASTPGGTPFNLITAGVGIHRLSAVVAASELRFPSRVVRSYPNYPEIFAGPFVAVPLSDGTSGDSVIDVNPADGQAIQRIIPFYAQSFTIAAQQEARLVALKERSVYMVNVETKEIQQIQTNGHGAYFPRSVAETRNGISFADQSGIHKIDRQSQWVFHGQILGRVYSDDFTPQSAVTDLPVALGAVHHNRYQLSMPDSASAVPTQVIVYDYTREVGGENGAWSTFDDYPVTTWTEFSGRTYHGDRDGLVYVDRAAGDDSDYRDDDHSYTATVLLRPMDFGAMGARKRLARIAIQFRRSGSTAVPDIQVAVATDGKLTFLAADSFVLNYAPPETNLSDLNQTSVHTISFTPPEIQADYYQLSISVAGIDEPVEICQVSYHVELLGVHGVTQAGQPGAT